MDEVGTDDLSCLDQDNHRYLSLTGVMVNLNHVDEFLNPQLRLIKNTIFDCDPDEVIHFHRSDIVRRKKVFGQLNDNAKRASFDDMMLNFIRSAEYRVITVVIDKLAMIQQNHWESRHPYHYLLEILVEKYVQLLERVQDFGDIMPEARQGKKDTALQQEFTRLWENGTRYREPALVQRRLKAKSLKFRRKTDNVSGLQLCDLIAHGSHMHVRSIQGHAVELGRFSETIRNVLVAHKYDRSNNGRIDGYGFKYCP
ncbi:MAG: DUF3800 domain-containing protein [Litoreibacter sp.]|uniref:DUF3800 domain-containing protein n=1 Tax=Litoreibacter sp. TaxID=1969459 RepID=UPI003296895E